MNAAVLLAGFAFEAFECCPFPLWVRDLNGNVKTVNPGAETLYLDGRNAKSIDDCVWLPEEVRQRARRGDQRVIESRSWQIEPTPEGVIIRWPVVEDGRITGVAGALLPNAELSYLIDLVRPGS